MDPRRGLVIGSAEASAPEQKYSLAEHTGAESGHGEGTPPRGDPANQLLDGDPQLFLGRPARVRQPCRPRHDRAALGLDGERAPRDLMPGIGLFIALRPRPDGDRTGRYSLVRSRRRVPSPANHLRTVSRQTCHRRATCPVGTPATASLAAPMMISAPLILPGSTSHGRTRSRWSQYRQRASATRRMRKRPGAAYLRGRERRVSARSTPPHFPHQHPSRSRSRRSPAARAASTTCS